MPDNLYAHTHGRSAQDGMGAVGGAPWRRWPSGRPNSPRRSAPSSLSRAAGLLHDVGKASARFQAYLRAGPERGPLHGWGQARHRALRDRLGKLLAYVVAGHHAGLPTGPGARPLAAPTG